MANKTIMLISFYNTVSISIHCLESALIAKGYSVRVVYLKNFRSFFSKKYQEINERELELLQKDIEECNPILIGLSVPCSLYLKTVNTVVDRIKKNFSIPFVIGGAYATLEPEYFLNNGIEFVIRSDGEYAITRLADAIANYNSYENIQSLCFLKDNNIIVNNIEVAEDIDSYGIPTIYSRNACYIDKGKKREGDPTKKGLTYETTASRGCPFSCSYCSAPILKQLLPKNIKPIRMRSVQSIIEELKEAKRQNKKLLYISFHDENFTANKEWIDEFAKEYKKHINLPFNVWIHPKMVSSYVVKKLIDIGLTEVLMGIQAGSEEFRNKVFHRYDTNKEIFEALDILQKEGISIGQYDFIINSPFETLQDAKENYNFMKQIPGRFVANIRQFKYLPHSEIINMVLEAGLYTEEQMNSIMHSSEHITSIQYSYSPYESKEVELTYKMMFCAQFQSLRKTLKKFEENPNIYEKQINKLYKIGKIYEKFKKFKRKIKFYYVINRIKLILKR